MPRRSAPEAFDHTINITEYDTPEARLDRVLELTGGRGANIAMELVGRAELLVEGVSYLTNGGTFIEIGDIVRGRTVEFDPSTILRGKKIMGSLMYRPHLLPLMMETLVKNQGKVPYERIVSNMYPLEKVNEAFAEAESERAPDRRLARDARALTLTRGATGAGGGSPLRRRAASAP